MIRHPRGVPRGTTLIEILTAISATVILIGLAVMLIHMLMSLGEKGRGMIAQQDAVFRLAELFRADVHAATRQSQEKSAGEQRLVLELPSGRSVEYRTVPQAVERLVRLSGKVTSRDIFRLSRGTAAKLEAEPAGSQARLRLLLERDQRQRHTVPAGRIEAVLGRDHRFEGGNP